MKNVWDTMADAEPLVDTLETHIENTREQNAEAVGFLMRWNFLNQALIPNAPAEDDEDIIKDASVWHTIKFWTERHDCSLLDSFKFF